MKAQDLLTELDEADGLDVEGVDLAQLIHALRNPLTAILIGSQHLASLDLGKRPTATAARVAQSAKDLAQLIDRLEQLAASRVKARP